MEWLNVYGLGIIVFIMIPNVLFAIRCKEGFYNAWHNKGVEILEQIGRYGCIAFMIVNIPYTYLGFWLQNGRLLYEVINGSFVFIYCMIWILCYRDASVFRALALSILPSAIFLFSGLMLQSIPLLIAASLFAPCHILLSYKNAVLSNASK